MLDPADAPSAEAYLAAIVESSDDAIIAKDLDGTIRWCNAATERIFGYPAEELIGRPVRILIPEDRQSEEDDILGRVRRGERIDHFETVRVAKDGHPIHISLTCPPSVMPRAPSLASRRRRVTLPRTNEGRRSCAIPAIALTAYARSEDRMRALTSGFQVHIAKPVESNELVAAIASLTGLMDAHRRTH